MIPAHDRLGRDRKFVKGHVARVTRRDEWPEDRKDRFRTLWLTGRTCRQIAEEMNMPRNSCPGRARRMGLPGRGSPLHDAVPNITSEERRRRDQTRQNELRRAKADKPKSVLRVVSDNSAPNAKPQLAKRVPRMHVDLEPSRNLLVGELTRELCAYPTSTEQAPTYSGVLHRFCACAVEKGKSFCAGHQAIAFPIQHVTEPKEEIAA
jgi:hypothetical protein